jgi:hypothetical protein
MSPLLGIYASSNYQRIAPDTGAMFPIAMANVGSAGAANISFTSIPSTYKHLQIRAIARTDYTGGNFDALKINFNSDTGNNYAWHQLGGNGSTAFAQAGSTTNTIYAAYISSNTAGSNIFGASVIDVLDYGSTSKYKTLRNLTGIDNNGNGNLTFGSGLWQSTSAITSITIDQWDGSNFNQYSQFALYGIKG